MTDLYHLPSTFLPTLFISYSHGIIMSTNFTENQHPDGIYEPLAPCTAADWPSVKGTGTSSP